MEDIILVEGLGSATFQNCILRIQLLATDGSGNLSETGTIEIPGNRVTEIINSLAKGAQEISAKIAESTAEASSDDSKKDTNGANKNKKGKKK